MGMIGIGKKERIEIGISKGSGNEWRIGIGKRIA